MVWLRLNLIFHQNARAQVNNTVGYRNGMYVAIRMKGVFN